MLKKLKKAKETGGLNPDGGGERSTAFDDLDEDMMADE